ncbi:hypothetical protein EDF58_1011338 [Novosphingobium sp. PhB57]|nr:hypothetical protein EDF58_1011338 [Novosphingobium sp. PhB57]
MWAAALTASLPLEPSTAGAVVTRSIHWCENFCVGRWSYHRARPDRAFLAFEYEEDCDGFMGQL